MSQGVRREPRKSPRRKINNFSKYFFMHRMYGWRSFFPIVLSIHFSFSFITGKQDAAYPSNSIQLGNKAISGSYIFIRWFRIFQLQGIKILWWLQILEYLRTLSLKFQKAQTKIEVVLSLPWLLGKNLVMKIDHL